MPPATAQAVPAPDWAVVIVYVLSPQSAVQVDQPPTQSVPPVQHALLSPGTFATSQTGPAHVEAEAAGLRTEPGPHCSLDTPAVPSPAPSASPHVAS